MRNTMERIQSWVRSDALLSFLAQVSADPACDAQLSGVVPEGGLLDVHIFALFGMLDELDELCPERLNSDKGFHAYTWLFHLLGGREAKLQPPPRCQTPPTTTLYKRLRKRADAHRDPCAHIAPSPANTGPVLRNTPVSTCKMDLEAGPCVPFMLRHMFAFQNKN